MSPCTKKVRWDWRILVHGYVDKPVAYEVDSFNQSLPFTELRARSLINELVKVADTNADFSERVRLGSPGVGQANNQIAAASRSHAITADDASQKFFNSHLAGQSVSFAP